MSAGRLDARRAGEDLTGPSRKVVELRGIEPLTLRLPEVRKATERGLLALSWPDRSGQRRPRPDPGTADGTQTAPRGEPPWGRPSPPQRPWTITNAASLLSTIGRQEHTATCPLPPSLPGRQRQSHTCTDSWKGRGIGHSSCVFARCPGMGLRSNP